MVKFRFKWYNVPHNNVSFSESKGWRQGYSYSERFSNNNNDNNKHNDNFGGGGRDELDKEFGDIIAMDDNRKREDFESKMNRINVRLPMPGGRSIIYHK